MFRRFQSFLLGERSTHRQAARVRALSPLAVEVLESRTLLSAASLLPEQLIVQFNPGVDADVRAAVRAQVGGVFVEHVETAAMRAAGHDGFDVITVAPGLSVAEAARTLKGHGSVRFAEPNWVLNHQATDPQYADGSLWGMYGETSPTAGPTNPFGSHADAAWAAGHTGSSGVYVAVIDTGIDHRHPDLFSNISINQAEIPANYRTNLLNGDSDGLITFGDLNSDAKGTITDLNSNGYIDAGDLLYSTKQGGWADGTDADGNGQVDDLVGWDFNGNDRTTYDGNSDNHGTHVAGTIGALGNNGIGVVGVNWNVSVIPVKFLGPNGGSIANAIKAVDYVTNLKTTQGLNIVATNNSWGGGGYSSALNDAIGRAATQNILFVAAAGNDGTNNDSTPRYPSNYDTTAAAGYDSVISVAAINDQGGLASFSNYGSTTVDLGAPGVGIWSTVTNGGYASYNGTSMATPHVTGAIASYAAAKAGATALTALEIKNAILSFATPTDSLAAKTVTGGRLNVANAVLGKDTTAPRVISVNPSGVIQAPLSSLRVTFSEAIDAASFTATDVTLTGPNARAITVTSVMPVDSQTFDIAFESQSELGDYALTIGPTITDTAGNPMTAAYTATFSLTSEPVANDPVTYTSTASVQIKDGWRSGSSLTIPDDITISDLNVTLNISHANVNDLVVYVVSPTGTRVDLVQLKTLTGANFTETVLDDEALLKLTDDTATAPFTGSYGPAQLLSAFDGKSAKGDWMLYVEDHVRNKKQGSINSWSLTVTGTLQASSSGSAQQASRTSSVSELIVSPARSTTVADVSPLSASQRREAAAFGDLSFANAIAVRTISGSQRESWAPAVKGTARYSGSLDAQIVDSLFASGDTSDLASSAFIESLLDPSNRTDAFLVDVLHEDLVQAGW